jgi:hypothetical protein
MLGSNDGCGGRFMSMLSEQELDTNVRRWKRGLYQEVYWGC